MNKSQKGFTLLEIMIAIMILAIGLLGLAGLQGRAHFAEIESYSRAQAIMLVGDLADRLNANLAQARPGGVCGADGCYDRATITYGQRASNCTGTAAPNPGYVNLSSSCVVLANSPCDALVTWNRDLCEWDRALLGAGETTGGTQVGALKNAVGCVSKVSTADNAAYLIQVAWSGTAQTGSVASDLTCGSAQIPAANRRVVSRVVRLAELAK